MINYVIINGVNSNTITGLMINELPPITKPQMRAMQEEIDGRDGDITTNLGYSAYDKTITIGLFGTGYDINDIVAFFNGEGTIVFSNEADKYYNFKILNQIDYVALQKFKSASITFHCQPFKYPLTETPLEIEYTYIEDEGENLTLNNTGEATLKLDLLGNTSQTGTPTPSNPIPVNVVSGDNEVVVSNSDGTQSSTYPICLPVENLWNEEWENGYYNRTTGEKGSGNAYLRCKDYQPITPNTDIYFNKPSEYINYAVIFYDSSKQIINSGTPSYIDSRTYTTPSNASYFTFFLDIGSGTATYNNNIMINLGNKPNSYTPYGTTPIELCKIGTYQDKFFKNIPNTPNYNNTLEENEWYLEKHIGKVVLDGSESYTNATAYYYILFSQITPRPKPSSSLLSNYFINTQENGNGGIWAGSGALAFNKNGLPSTITDLASFKTWLGNNNTTIYYQMPTPTYTQITGTLKDELDEVYRASSFEGTTNITQNNNDKAFIISAKALEQGSNEVVVNNIGNAYSKPLIALEGNGNVDIYLDNTQILKANVEDKMNIDIAQLEAYNPDTSALLNRQVIGNYNSMTVPSGTSIIRMDGDLTKATITNYTRWL